MEIIDYLRIVRKRIALLLVIPLVAAGLAAGYVLHAPQTYTATATLSTGTLVGNNGDFTGPQATNQFVAAFSAAAVGPMVINQVSAKTGVGPTALRAGLSVAQSGASSDMTVTFEGATKDTVQSILRTEVESTLSSMFQPRFDAAVKQRDTAQNAVNDANAAVAAYAKKVGMADPPQAYQSTLNQVSSLQQQRATLMATGNALAAQSLSYALKAAQDKLAKFGPILQGYADVSAIQRAAEADFTAAQTQYRQAQSQLESATATNVTYISPTVASDRMSTLLTLVLPVFAAGFLLAFVLAIGLELLGSAKRAEADAVEADAVEADAVEAKTAQAEGISPATVFAAPSGAAGEAADGQDVEPSTATDEVDEVDEEATDEADSATEQQMVPEELDDDDLVELRSMDTPSDETEPEPAPEPDPEPDPIVMAGRSGKGRLHRHARVIR